MVCGKPAEGVWRFHELRTELGNYPLKQQSAVVCENREKNLDEHWVTDRQLPAFTQPNKSSICDISIIL